MTRWARCGSTQRHRKLPEDPTPWEELVSQKRDSENVNEGEKKKKLRRDKTNKKDRKRKLKQNKDLANKCETTDVKPTLFQIVSSEQEEDIPLADAINMHQKKKGNSKVHEKLSISDSNNISEFPEGSSHIKEKKTKGTMPDSMDVETGELESSIASSAGQTVKRPTNLKKKRNFYEQVKDNRLKNGILLLPKNVENKLYKMKKGLRAKGMPEGKIKGIIRQFRRKEELRFRKTLKTCYNCRKTGHVLSNCPLIVADSEQGTGICFKCGSTEHTSYKCTSRISGFPYAKCFICKEQGHLSKDCPKNKHGAYPKGGKCNFCGDINHLKKDCPKLKKNKKEEEELTADVIDGSISIDAEIIEPNTCISVTNDLKKPKFVKF